jgi:hypothetical protein
MARLLRKLPHAGRRSRIVAHFRLTQKDEQPRNSQPVFNSMLQTAGLLWVADRASAPLGCSIPAGRSTGNAQNMAQAIQAYRRRSTLRRRLTVTLRATTCATAEQKRA